MITVSDTNHLLIETGDMRLQVDPGDGVLCLSIRLVEGEGLFNQIGMTLNKAEVAGLHTHLTNWLGKESQ